MFSLRQILPAFLLVSASYAAPQAEAQTSIPLYTTKHCVQVEWYFWRSGGTYWSTEFETTDLGEAQLIFELFDSALENGTLCDILGCNFPTWIPIDVRLKTKYERNFNPIVTPYVQTSGLTYRSP